MYMYELNMLKFQENCMSKLTIYHGGYKEITQPKIMIGRNTKD